MDNTYKPNKYRKPMFEIVGMTSTELTFGVAFSYMEYELTENFLCALEAKTIICEERFVSTSDFDW